MRERRQVSSARRVVFASVLILLSLVSHAAAANSLPSTTALGGGAAVAGGIAWSLTGQRRSLSSLIVIVFAGQLLIHAAVVALGHHGVGYVPSGRMLLAHLVAAGIASALFSQGERIVATWIRAASRVLGVTVLRLPAVAQKAKQTLPSPRPAFLVESMHDYTVSRRGPPLMVGAPTFA